MEPIRNKLTKQKKFEIALRLRNANSFYKCYYELLPNFTTKEDCYTFLNKIYQNVFMTDNNMFKDFKDFRKSMYCNNG